jgi:hypothetical protein
MRMRSLAKTDAGIQVPPDGKPDCDIKLLLCASAFRLPGLEVNGNKRLGVTNLYPSDERLIDYGDGDEVLLVCECRRPGWRKPQERRSIFCARKYLIQPVGISRLWCPQTIGRRPAPTSIMEPCEKGTELSAFDLCAPNPWFARS